MPVLRARTDQPECPSRHRAGVGGRGPGPRLETFRSFTAVEDDRVLAFACTLQQEGRLPGKIKSDVEVIVSGGAVDMVYMFCGANLVTSRRHQLIDWARAQHQVELVIIDGNALAEQLAASDVYWIAERFLSLPGQLVLGHPALSASAGLPRRARALVGRDSELGRGVEWLCT